MAEPIPDPSRPSGLAPVTFERGTTWRTSAFFFALSAFLAYGFERSGKWPFLVFALLLLFAAWSTAQSTRVEADPVVGTLTLATSRWPFPPGRITLPLDQVTAVARVTVGQSRGRVPSYGVQIVVSGRERPVIVFGGSAGKFEVEQAATEIDLLLRAARKAQTLAS